MIDFPDYLFEYFDPKIIYFFNCELNDENKEHGVTAEVVPLVDEGIYRPAFIYINLNDCEEEQIQTLLHEIMHYHPRFASYTVGTGLPYPKISEGPRGSPIDEKIESAIEKSSQYIYDNQKDVVERARKVLRDAKSIEKKLND